MSAEGTDGEYLVIVDADKEPVGMKLFSTKTQQLTDHAIFVSC